MPRPNTYQQIIIQGVLEKDPEVRSLQNGTLIVNLKPSTESSYKDKAGEWKTKKEWHTVVVFGQEAEKLKNCVKGDGVFIIGQNETRSYEVDGVKKYTTEVKADRVFLLGAGALGDPSTTNTSSAPRTAASSARTTAAPAARTSAPAATRATIQDDPFADGTGITDDDIPF